MPQARRLRQVVLVHMPLGHRPPDDEAGAVRAREREVLAAAAAVVTTSAWTRRRLAELYALPADRVHVAEPGVDAAGLAPGTAAGDALLCVAAVTPDKGHDVLLDALATATDLSWRCACVGSLDRDPAFADGVRRRARTAGCGDRVRFPGPRTGAGARPRVRRRGPARARLARRDLRHGRHRGPGPRPAGPRRRGRRGDRGPRARGGRHPAGAAGRRPATRRPSAPRCGPGSATPSCAGACAAPPASGARRCAAGRPPRPSSPASSRERRDERGRPSGSARSGSSCASRPTRRRARPSSPSASARHLPAAGRLVIHDLGGGSGAMGRWLAPRLPGPQHWVVHDRDADLLELAVADRRAGADGRGHRRGEAVRHHPAGAGRSRRREPHRRLGAARHADRGRAGRGCSAPAPGVPDAARADRRRSRRPDARRIRWTRASAPRSTPTSAARRRGRLLGPDAVAAAVEELRADGRRGPRPAEPLAPRRGPRRPDGRVARAGGSPPPASRSPRWPPRPAPTGTGAWRRRPPGSSPSPSTMPTCWCCRDDRRHRAHARAAGPRGGGPASPPPPRRSPSWSGAWARARSSTACARSTAGRWRPRPASPC